MYHRFHNHRAGSRERTPGHPGFRFCVEPLAIVSTESRYGLHRCVVTQPYGSTVDDLQVAQPGVRFKLPVVKNIVRQTLLALDFLHNDLDVVHAGACCGDFYGYCDVASLDPYRRQGFKFVYRP